MEQNWLHRAGGLVESRLASGRGLLGRGAFALRRLSERIAFAGDSLVWLAMLLLANLLRLHFPGAFPGAVAEALFVVAVLLMALALLRGRVAAEVRPVLLCFGALSALYAIGLIFAFSWQGVRHLAGVLAAGVIFLFSQHNGPTWLRKLAVFVLPAAMLAMLPLYFMEVGQSAHAAILGYLLLAVGLALVVRSEEARRQHWWAHVFFLLFVGNGVFFGHYFLVGGLLLAYPLYWGAHYFLRSRKGAGVLAAAVAALACLIVGTFAGPPLGGAEGRVGEEAQTGQNRWRLALAGIAQAPWLGWGPGAIVAASLTDHACLNDSNPRLVADCKALVGLRRTLAGGSKGLWSWDYAYPIASWRGVTLGGAPPRVTELDLSSFGLSGRLPPEIAQLDQLVSLNLAVNALSGGLPPALGGMANLQFLALSNNDLSGPIPAELGRLEQLTNLRLDGNRLSGAIPSALDELLELRELTLAGNELTGPIAPALRRVAEHDLDQGMLCLSSTAAAGWIGPGLLKDCTNLLAARDVLAPTGGLNWHAHNPIPLWDGVVLRGTPLRVAELSLPRMNLVGSLPRELGALEQLEVLNVGHNRLTGPIPPEFGRLANLGKLVVDYNALTGGIPPELGNLKRLEELWLRENRLSGSIPAALETLPKLHLLRLRGNPLTGTPPSALFAIPDQDLNESLFCLPLETSSAEGVGPGLLKDCGILLAARETLAGTGSLNWRRNQPIGLWRGLTLGGAPLRVVALHLENMDLAGRIPEQLGGLEQLVSLRLAGNQLTGPVPAEIGNLKNLVALSLENNRLPSGVPPELLALPKLELFHYVSEDLAGVVPAVRQPSEGDSPAQTLFCMPPSKLNPVSAALFEDCTLLLEMRDVLAGGAKLNWRRSLPINSWRGVALGGVGLRVVALDLHGAGLRGRLPAQLARLDGLESLRLSNNPLAGPIPAELSGLKNLVEFRLGDGALPEDLLFCLPLPPTNPGLLKDCTALLAMRDLLAGDANLNWRRSTPLNAWEGINIDGAPLRVTALRLPQRGLKGRLPAGLAALDQLRALNLCHNWLRGAIPAELANLANLRILNLCHNRLTGPIPPEFGRLMELRRLILIGNQLSGAIPAELGALFNLKRLRLRGNRFEDSVAPALRELPDHDLDHELFCLSAPAAASQAVRPALLGDCALLLQVRDALAGGANLNWRSSVPIGLWQGVKLGDAPVRVLRLELDGMGLNGRLPPELGRLTGLRTLSLERNALTGPIPPEFGKLSNLRILRLRDNQLSGPIAPQLQALERLSLLRLSGNDFRPPIPAALRRVADSDLNGRPTCPLVPRSNLGLVDDCANLLAIRDLLAGSAVLDWSEATPMNAWHGVALQGEPPRVASLNVGWRAPLLDGRIPAALSRLERLTSLNLAGHDLQGPVPAELGKLRNLKSLSLGNNSLTGPIPATLGDLGNLEHLYLEHNSLTGPIPTALGRLAKLTDLALCGNSLTGPIPVALGDLGNLEYLSLCHNSLTGAIPTELGNIKSLRRLALQHNRLSGAVPPTMAALPQLRLEGNALSRDFPPPPSLDESRGLDAEALVTKALASAIAAGEAGAAQLCDPTSNHPPPNGLQKDCAILLEARDLLTGGVALNWSPSTPVGLWRGVALGGEPPRIIALDLAHMGLRGAIPAQLGGLDQLISLRLQRNALKSAIPDELGGLANLQEMMLDGNAPAESASLGEPAPKDRIDQPDQPNRASRNGVTCGQLGGQASGLRKDCATLLAVKDELAGNASLNWSEALPINAWRGVWAGGEPVRIMALDLPSAGLDGRIPQRLTELERLASLQLSGNRLTGPIPAELGDLQNLELLRLSNNRLSGAIPPQLGGLAALRRLALDGNELTGGIPTELAKLAALEELRLANNSLSGSVPPQLASLDNLALLRLGGNEFIGCLAPALKGAGDVRLEADLACDPSPWAKPPLLEDAAVLMAVRDLLAGGAKLNWSYGEPIASWQGVSVAGAPPRVVAIDLSGAGLNGRIPAELGTLRQLGWLRLNNNRLTGTIPPELSQLTNLRELALQGNALTGAMPPELQHLANLEELRLGGNRLSGAVPPELGRMGSLGALQLGGNAFTGCLPEALRRFSPNLHRTVGLPTCDERARGDEAAGIDAVVHALTGLFEPAAPVETAASAHNLFLQVGLQTGVLGLLTAALLCASLIFSIRSRTGGEVAPVQRFVATCVVMVIVHNLFAVHLLQNSLSVGTYSWILMGMGVGVVGRSLNEEPA